MRLARNLHAIAVAMDGTLSLSSKCFLRRRDNDEYLSGERPILRDDGVPSLTANELETNNATKPASRINASGSEALLCKNEVTGDGTSLRLE